MKRATTLIGGLHVHTYANDEFATSTKPVFALFVLHGRLGSTQSKNVQDLIAALVTASREAHRDLLLVAFDLRNHGTRLVEGQKNQGFETNPNHVLDMYTTQVGTARDVSFLMDFLEPYLFPLGERRIEAWGVSGISLGGHSAWMVGAYDPRVSVVIPIIGCPDYLALMGERAEAHGLSIAPPQFPAKFVDSIKALPVAAFVGKKVLVLSGRDDTLVPFEKGKAFIEELRGQALEKLEVKVFPGGHEVSESMVKEVVNFIMAELV